MIILNEYYNKAKFFNPYEQRFIEEVTCSFYPFIFGSNEEKV